MIAFDARSNAATPQVNNVLSDIAFAKIPAGSFMMGARDFIQGLLASSPDETPIHKVTISRSFEMQTTEVTQAQWFALTGNNPSISSKSNDCPREYELVEGVSLCPNSPVENVSWNDAQAFIEILNAKRDGYRYRLPTEAEWEYAARGGTSGLFGVSGNFEDFGWGLDLENGTSHAVGQKIPNAWGLYDMHGNVREWTSDWYGTYPSVDVTDPLGPTNGPGRVNRGGAWTNDSVGSRSAIRYENSPSFRTFYIGFRLVRTTP